MVVAADANAAPEDLGAESRAAALDAALAAAGFPAAPRVPCSPFAHIFSHVRHTMHVEYAALPVAAAITPSGVAADGRSYSWMDAEEMARVGVTKGVKKVLAAVEESISRQEKRRGALRVDAPDR